MRVGILINMKDNPYGRIMHAAKMGFRSGQISMWKMEMYNDDIVAEIKKACEEFDFTITAVWCGWSGPIEWGYPNMYTTLGLVPAAWRSQRVGELLKGAAFARALGVKDIVTHLGYMPDNPMHEDRIAVVQAVRYICKEIAPYGQRFLFETGEELPLTLVQMMHETGAENLGVNFDPANLLINARANPVDALDLLGPYVCGMHGKDGVYPQGIQPKGKEVKIGQGRADFPSLIKKLVELGYDGDITIEREVRETPEREKEIADEKVFLEEIIAKVKGSQS